MLSVGDAIALASVCSVIIVGLLRYKPAAAHSPTNGDRPVTHDLCMARFNSIRSEICEVKSTLDKIWASLDGHKEK